MNIKKKPLIISVLIPLLVGGLSAFITRKSMDIFEVLEKPPLSPPSWLFPVVWTVLYILMGISSYLIYTADTSRENKTVALSVYALQLVFNFIWPILFFNMQNFLGALVCLIILWILILTMIIVFSRISKPAAFLNIPYLLWVTFAGYLNYFIYLLN